MDEMTTKEKRVYRVTVEVVTRETYDIEVDGTDPMYYRGLTDSEYDDEARNEAFRRPNVSYVVSSERVS